MGRSPCYYTSGVSHGPVRSIVFRVGGFVSLNNHAVISTAKSRSVKQSTRTLQRITLGANLGVITSSNPCLRGFRDREVRGAISRLTAAVSGRLGRKVNSASVHTKVVNRVNISPAFARTRRGDLQTTSLTRVGGPRITVGVRVPN